MNIMDRMKKIEFLKAWQAGIKPSPVLCLFIEEGDVIIPGGKTVKVDEAFEWASQFTPPPKVIEFVDDPRDAPLNDSC